MSSDGVTVADGGYVAGSTQKGALELWNASTGNLISSLPTTASTINQVAFSPDGTTLAAAGLNAANGIELWNVATQHLQGHLPAPGVVLGMSYSPDGTMIAIGGSYVMGLTQTGYVETWNVASQQKLLINSGCLKVNSVSYSHDGKTIADVGPSSQGHYLVEVWDATSGNLIGLCPQCSGTMYRRVSLARLGAAKGNTGGSGLTSVTSQLREGNTGVVMNKTGRCNELRSLCRNHKGIEYPPREVVNVFEHLREKMTANASNVPGAGDGFFINTEVVKDV
jgi:WD40 repeat protein